MDFAVAICAGMALFIPCVDFVTVVGDYGLGYFLNYMFTREISVRPESDGGGDGGNGGQVAKEVDTLLTTVLLHLPQSAISHTVHYNKDESLTLDSSDQTYSVRPTVTCQTRVTFTAFIDIGNMVPIAIPGMNSPVTFEYINQTTRENVETQENDERQ